MNQAATQDSQEPLVQFRQLPRSRETTPTIAQNRTPDDWILLYVLGEVPPTVEVEVNIYQ